MGLKTLAQFRTDLQLALGNRGFLDPQLDTFINTGLADLVSRMEFAENEGSFDQIFLTGVSTFLPALTLAIIEAQNVTDELFMTRFEEAAWSRRDQTLTGEPTHWFRDGNTVHIWPVPTVDTTVRFQTRTVESVLVGDGATTNLQSMWDRALHLLAVAHALVDLEEAERSVFFFNSASRYMSTRIGLDKLEGQGTGEPVQPVDSFEELRRNVQRTPIL